MMYKIEREWSRIENSTLEDALPQTPYEELRHIMLRFMSSLPRVLNPTNISSLVLVTGSFAACSRCSLACSVTAWSINCSLNQCLPASDPIQGRRVARYTPKRSVPETTTIDCLTWPTWLASHLSSSLIAFISLHLTTSGLRPHPLSTPNPLSTGASLPTGPQTATPSARDAADRGQPRAHARCRPPALSALSRIRAHFPRPRHSCAAGQP